MIHGLCITMLSARDHGVKKDEPAQSTSKADIHQKKMMLSVWWDLKESFILSFYRTTQQ